MYIFTVFLAAFWSAYVSAVYVGWPMSEQLPNVARVGEKYLFTLAQSTYKSSAGGTILYSAENLPTWLKFDSISRTFSGTPAAEDVYSFQIALVGTDSADQSVYNASYSMLVSNNSGLTLSSSDVLFTQIAQYGKTNGVDGLVLSQSQSFSIKFTKNVFKPNAGATRPIIAYYGRSGDRTSLPNWIHFDADALTFSGQAPHVVSATAPSSEYTFAFIGSDYTGYTGAEGVFKIIVGGHQLSTSLSEAIKINGTYLSKFDYSVPILTHVYLDNVLISRENISSVTANNLPDYVQFDQNSYSLKGTFPNASSFQNFSVVVADKYGGRVTIPYLFDSLNSVFTINSLSDVNAMRNHFFQYRVLHSYFTDFNATTVSVTFGEDSTWLTYHESNMTIDGQAPSNLELVSVKIDARSDFGSDLRSFNIVGVDKPVSESSSSSASSSSETSAPSSSSLASTATATSSGSPSDGATNLNKKTSENHRKMVLGLAIGLPLLALVLALLLLLFCCCRRKKNSQDDDETHPGTGAEPELTGPGFGRTDSNDDHKETAQQLATLNALKLEQDNKSVLSSLTHIDSEDSEYFNASEKPLVSWRADGASDSSAMKKMLRQEKHASDVSMNTVNTEQLFTVRLVDDSNSARESAQSFQNRKSGELLGVIRDGSSGNIQRLDSDGNVVTLGNSNTVSSKIPPSGTRRILNNILEEDTSNHMFNTQESSDYDLLTKFLGLQNALLNLESTENSDSELQRNQCGNQHGDIENGLLLPSPNSESFLLGRDSAEHGMSPYLGENKDAVLSRASLYSDLSLTNAAGTDEGSQGRNAKLVNFTRKASLRGSCRQQYVDHSANKGQIFEDSD